MKYLKKFEMFSDTGIDDSGSEVVPKYNPKIRGEVVKFLDELSPSNRPKVFKWVRKESPKMNDPKFDEEFENVKKIVIDYFESNPNVKIPTIDDMDNFIIPKKMGDGVSRVQNIGGVGRR
jgi:hypothetical protein